MGNVIGVDDLSLQVQVDGGAVVWLRVVAAETRITVAVGRGECWGCHLGALMWQELGQLVIAA